MPDRVTNKRIDERACNKVPSDVRTNTFTRSATGIVGSRMLSKRSTAMTGQWFRRAPSARDIFAALHTFHPGNHAGVACRYFVCETCGGLFTHTTNLARFVDILAARFVVPPRQSASVCVALFDLPLPSLVQTGKSQVETESPIPPPASSVCVCVCV